MNTKTVLASSFASLVFTACVPGTFGGSATLPSYRAPASQPAPNVTPDATPAAATAAATAATIAPAQATAIADAMDRIQWMHWNEDQLTQSDANAAYLVPVGQACSEAVDRALAAGVPVTTEIDGDGLASGKSVLLGEAKAKVCELLITKGKAWDGRVATAKADAYAKASAPYKAAGIGGDKLDLLVRHDTYAMQGVGGVALDTPKKLANAAVIFELMEPTTGGYVLRRYQFKGNAQLAQTEASFDREPSIAAYR